MKYLSSILALASFSEVQALDKISLPKLGARTDTVTISGYSAGSYMAHALHVIWSSRISGAFLLMGGPYYSAFIVPATNFIYPFWEWPQKGLTHMTNMYNSGLIDNPWNLGGQPVRIIAGLWDFVVPVICVEDQRDFYHQVS